MTPEDITSLKSQLSFMNGQELRQTVLALLAALSEKTTELDALARSRERLADSLKSIDRTLDYYTKMGVGRGY